MALTLPNVVWELGNEVSLSPADDANEHLTELKAAIIGTTAGWRVLADDIGAGDSYLWIAGPLGGPIADLRIFYWLSKAATSVHADNRAIGQGTGNASGYVWVGMSPDDAGATPNATDPTAATDIFNSRSTGMALSGYWDGSNPIDRIQLVSCSEMLWIDVWSTGSGTFSWHSLFGPQYVPTDDAGGESGDNGRIYGMQTSGTTNQGDFNWTNDASFLIAGSGTVTVPKAYAFDPATPANCIQVKCNNRFDVALTNPALDYMKEDHGGTDVLVHHPIFYNDVTTPFKRIGRLRQIRMSEGRGDRKEIRSGGSGPAKTILFSAWPTTNSGCIGFDNDGV